MNDCPGIMMEIQEQGDVVDEIAHCDRCETAGLLLDVLMVIEDHITNAELIPNWDRPAVDATIVKLRKILKEVK